MRWNAWSRQRRIIRAPDEPLVDSGEGHRAVPCGEPGGECFQGSEARDGPETGRMHQREGRKGQDPHQFPALSCISTVRSPHPEYRCRTAESICEEPGPFSLTVLVKEGEQKRRIFSNFVPLIRLLRSRIGDKTGGIPRNQTFLDTF